MVTSNPGPSATTGSDQSPAGRPRTRKVALEEHFMLPAFVDYLAETKANIRTDLFDRAVPVLSDFGEQRLALMDRCGIDYAVLSLSGPGVQIEPDTATAVRLARQCNDALATEMQRRPQRYGGFAHLALQDPRAAADELTRCVRDLGFQGALINGETNGRYLDERIYDVFWERVADLQVPVYLHPGNPPDLPHMFAGVPVLWGPTWSWAVETCTHALRLIFTGLFDRYPTARIILGHMGETLPIQLWRLDSRCAISNQTVPLKHPPSHYVRKNVWITTSGVCDDVPLRCALDAMGATHVMFAVDHPFEDTAIATGWIERAAITDAERALVCHGNATSLLRLRV
jgi:2,3-dihydroxybenzoate decarboxylase